METETVTLTLTQEQYQRLRQAVSLASDWHQLDCEKLSACGEHELAVNARKSSDLFRALWVDLFLRAAGS